MPTSKQSFAGAINHLHFIMWVQLANYAQPMGQVQLLIYIGIVFAKDTDL